MRSSHPSWSRGTKTPQQLLEVGPQGDPVGAPGTALTDAERLEGATKLQKLNSLWNTILP